MKDIIMYGHSGSGNHGCEAIIRSTMKVLQQQCVVYSNSPEQDKKYGINEQCLRQYAKKIKKNSFRRYFYAVYSRIFRNSMLRYKYVYQPFLQNIEKETIYLSVGGDHYCYGTYSNHIYDFLNDNVLKNGGKSVLWSCSIEEKDLDKRTINSLKQYDLITARESISYNALKTININTVKVADPAFTLPKKLLSLPDNWLERNMVGINASPLILQNGKDSNTVYMAYRMLIQEILDHTDCGVALIPHVVCDGNNDLEVLAQLYDEFKDNDRIMLIGDHNCMELKGYIARCRFFVGARTHATIAAYSSCVPTLVLGYSVKSRGIARDLFGNEENYVLPVQSLQEPDELTKHFRWLVGHEKEIKDHLEKIMPEYISKAYSGKMALDKLVR